MADKKKRNDPLVSDPIPRQFVRGAHNQYGYGLTVADKQRIAAEQNLPPDSNLLNVPVVGQSVAGPYIYHTPIDYIGKFYSRQGNFLDPETGKPFSLQYPEYTPSVPTDVQAEENKATTPELAASRYGYARAAAEGRVDPESDKIITPANAPYLNNRTLIDIYGSSELNKAINTGRFDFATGTILPVALSEYEIALASAPENTIPVFNQETGGYTYRKMTQDELNNASISNILAQRQTTTVNLSGMPNRSKQWSMPDITSEEDFNALKATVLGNMLPDTYSEYLKRKAEQSNTNASVLTSPSGSSRAGVASAYNGGLTPVDNAVDLANRFPALASALLEQNMSINDVASAYNVAKAQSVADAALEALKFNDQSRAQQLLAVQSPNVGLLASEFLNERIRKLQAATQESADLGESGIVKVGKWLWNLVPGPMLDLLLKGTEATLHAVRSFSKSVELGTAHPDWSYGDVVGKAWLYTEQGSMNGTILENARNDPRFGAKATDIMIEAYKASIDDSGDALDALYAKYRNDPEAMRIINTGLNGLNPAGTNYSELWNIVASADQGNLGNLMGIYFNVKPGAEGSLQNIGFKALRDVTNVTSVFLFDPLLIGGKAMSVYKYTKYGIHLMADTTKLDAAFKLNKVRNWFDWYGGEIQKIKNIRASGDEVTAARRENVLRSQSKRYATDDTYDVFYKNNIHSADEAHHFLSSLETVERVMRGRPGVLLRPRAGRKSAGRLKNETPRTYENVVTVNPDVAKVQRSFIEAQSASRVGKVYTPHMFAATSKAKEVMAATRMGADISGRILARSSPVLDEVLGKDFTHISPDAQLERVSKMLQDPAVVKRLGDELGDFTGRRTLAGWTLDKIVKDEKLRKKLGLDQKGWRRKRMISQAASSERGVLAGAAEGLARRLDSWGRFVAHVPDSRLPISFATPHDADRVYQLLRHAGVHRGAANVFRSAWVRMNEAQRRASYIGLLRTYAHSSGIHLVDPENGMKSLLESITGVRSTELHSANQIPRFGALNAEVDAITNERVAEIEKLRNGRLDPSEIADIRADVMASKLNSRELDATLDVINPSMRGDISSAVWLGQASEFGFFPNIQALDALTARSTMLNALLFNNKLGTDITSWWTLATLAGPRFQLRNGIEEIGLYALTGGEYKAFMTGRKVSTALRETSERFNPSVIEARTAELEARQRLEFLKNNNGTEVQIARAQEDLAVAAKNLAEEEARYGGRGKKLGFVKTTSRAIASRIIKHRMNQLEGQGNGLAAYFLPYLSKDEVSAASRVATDLRRGWTYDIDGNKVILSEADKENFRTLLVKWQANAVIRQFFSVSKDKRILGIIPRLRRGAAVEDLSSYQQQVIKDFEDLLRTPHGLEYQDMAAEASRHFSDGVMPAVNDMRDFSVIDGQLYHGVSINEGYASEKVVGRVNYKQAESLMINLTMAVSDGPMGQSVLRNLERYWMAYNRAGSSDLDAMEVIVNNILKDVEASGLLDYYLTRMTNGAVGGAEEMISRALMDMTGTFTTTNGKFNYTLYNRMKTVADDGSVRFSLTDNVDGKIVPRVTADDFLSGKIPSSANVNVYSSEKYMLPASDRFDEKVWATMGRSYARMTREPIWQANYLDAREVYRPFERQWAKVFGEDKAAEMAADAAAERAYGLTMAYADNPAVRSLFAWRMRNVARFYRAIEDFGRRMGRVAEHNPMAFWKASLAWNATQDTGWVYTDKTTGDQYFIYPGSKAAINVMNKLYNLLGVDMQIPDLKMNMTGKLTWITPSADPESWLPTFSGLWSAVLYRPALRAFPGVVESLPMFDKLPGLRNFTKELEKSVFGSIAADQKMTNVFEDVPLFGDALSSVPSAIPPILNKFFFGVAPALFKMDSPGSFAAKMKMRAALAMAANGDTPPADSTPAEINAYLDRLDKTALGLSFMSMFFGLTAPAAPQINSAEVSEFGRQMGLVNLTPAFYSLIQAEQEAGGSYETALAKWFAADSSQAIFTLSQSKIGDFGRLQATTDNVNFVLNNADLWKSAPTGMAYFAPNTGTDSIAAARMMSLFGFKVPADPNDYAKQLLTQQGYIDYTINRSMYYDSLNNATGDQKSMADKAWSNTSYTLMQMYPGLDQRVMGRDMKQSSEWAGNVQEMIIAAEALSGQSQYAKDFLDFLPSYKKISYDMNVLDRSSATYDDTRSIIKKAWTNIVWDSIVAHPNDDQWKKIVYAMTKAIDESWTIPYSDPRVEEAK